MINGPDARCERIPDHQRGILNADLHPGALAIAKSTADPAGRYSRTDAVRLVINREKQAVIRVAAVAANPTVPMARPKLCDPEAPRSPLRRLRSPQATCVSVSSSE